MGFCQLGIITTGEASSLISDFGMLNPPPSTEFDEMITRTSKLFTTEKEESGKTLSQVSETFDIWGARGHKLNHMEQSSSLTNDTRLANIPPKKRWRNSNIGAPLLRM